MVEDFPATACAELETVGENEFVEESVFLIAPNVAALAAEAFELILAIGVEVADVVGLGACCVVEATQL